MGADPDGSGPDTALIGPFSRLDTRREHFACGALEHTLIVGLDYYHFNSRFEGKYDRNPPIIDLFSPTYDLSQPPLRLKGVKLGLNVKNLEDKTCVDRCSSEWDCYYGEGRTVVSSLTYDG